MIAIVWLALMAVAFYFLLVRPQRRQMQAMRDLQGRLEEGDEIVTSSGIYGRILTLDEDTAEVEIAPGTTIRLARGAVAQRLGPDRPDLDLDDPDLDDPDREDLG